MSRTLPTHFLFIDFEGTFTEETSLRRNTLRRYLSTNTMTMLTLAVDTDPVLAFDPDEVDDALLADLRRIAGDPDWCVVAHNAAFDVRAWRFWLGLPQPQNVLCTLELCCAAFPNQAGGYSLDNLARTLNTGLEKIEIDLKTATGDELRRYCAQDTEICRRLFRLAYARLPPIEIRAALLTNQVRELHLDIDRGAVAKAQTDFNELAEGAATDLLSILGADEEAAGALGYKDADGRKAEANFDDEGRELRVSSVKPQALKHLLLDRLGFETQSISEKKINPEKLRASPEAAKALQASGRANKALTFARRVSVFNDLDVIDMELGYARATATLRFSSPAPGCRGLNLHNCVPAETPVLTGRGWVPILHIRSEDTIWNGTKFVSHTGVVSEGRRRAVTTLGLSLTPEHPIWTGRRMVAVVDSTPCQRALALVAGCLSSLRRLHGGAFSPPALPAAVDSWASRTGSTRAPTANDAPSAHVRALFASYLTTLCERFMFAGIATCSTATGAAATLTSRNAATGWCQPGKTPPSSSALARLCLDGLTWLWTWIESTPRNPTALATSVSSLPWSTPAPAGTRSLLMGSLSSRSLANVESLISKRTTSTSRAVYDLTGCGKFQTPLILVSNCPKRDKKLAKILRSMFRFPEGMAAVRADLMNVEYRVQCFLCECAYAYELFGRNPMADPYLGFGNQATGRIWTKADPIRQLFKAAVLGLGYLMSLHRFAEELLRGLADPTFGVSLDDLRRVCADMKWVLPTGKAGTYPRSAMAKLRCPEAVMTVAYHMRELFHQMHPEFARTARWLEDTVAECLRSLNPERTIDRCYEKPNAPNRAKLDLRYMADAFGPGTRSFGLHPNGWPHPTVVWRDVAVRECLVFGKVGYAVTAMHARKGYRPLTKQILIENCVQSAARCGMVEGQDQLADEYPYELTVHDELMLLVEHKADAVVQARADILRVFAPNTGTLTKRWAWSCLANPDEINVSKTLFEVDMGKLLPEYPTPAAWWQSLAAGNHRLLETLP